VNTPGAGVSGTVDGIALRIGTPAYVSVAGPDLPKDARFRAAMNEGMTIVLLADTERLLAAFVLEDGLRPGAKELVADLKRRGKAVSLLTGDGTTAARRIAREIGIDAADVLAELDPAAKLAQIKRWQDGGAIVAMVGDGVNDAPVLAAATVSIAMSSAAAVSATSADMLLLAQDLQPISTTLDIARRTMAIIRQNLAWAVAYNLIAVPIAAAGWVTPWMAALGMSASSALVVANALRLTRQKV